VSRPPNRATLFAAFLSIGLSGFGGVLPFARRTLVERRGWMTAEEFNETLSLCQTLPGPNIVNVSVVVGARSGGWTGSLAAVSGLMGAPVVIVLALAALYDRFGALPAARGAIAGLGAAAAGLVAATAARMAEPLLKPGHLVAAAPVMLAAFAAVGLMRAPLPYAMLLLAPLSIAMARRLRP